jgi:hypothetical protein
MGILDEAIRDHLELKRKGGVQEADLKRLEDEAFGPPSRPGDAAAAVAAPAQAPEALRREPSPPNGAEEEGPEVGVGQEPPGVGGQEDASAEASPEAPAQPSAEPDVAGMFHDFAAEEGLVSPGAEAPAVPAEPDVAREREDRPEPPPEQQVPREPAAEEPAPAGAPPAQEASLDDTQPHDMQAELGEVEERGPEQAEEPTSEPSEELEIADEDLELRLEDDEDQPSGDLRVVEEAEELVVEEAEVEEIVEDEGEEGEDVLEETPEFLRESPEHDRLWFEQRPPKDFDFDE